MTTGLQVGKVGGEYKEGGLRRVEGLLALKLLPHAHNQELLKWSRDRS